MCVFRDPGLWAAWESGFWASGENAGRLYYYNTQHWRYVHVVCNFYRRTHTWYLSVKRCLLYQIRIKHTYVIFSLPVSDVQLSLHHQVRAPVGDPSFTRQWRKQWVSVTLIFWWTHSFTSFTFFCLVHNWFFSPSVCRTVSQRVVHEWKLLDHHC